MLVDLHAAAAVALYLPVAAAVVAASMAVAAAAEAAVDTLHCPVDMPD